MGRKSLGLNTILNVIKSGLAVVFPLITYPYVLRILGEEGIGKVSYTASIISYFSLIAMLGVGTYAIREGAKKRTDSAAFQQFVNEVFTINIYSTIIAYLLLFCAIFFLDKLHGYVKLLLLQSLSILLTTLSVDWINTIFEDFVMITVRSIITYALSLIFLFMFVRKPEDYYWYALLTVITNGIICLSNWFYIRKYVKLRIVRNTGAKTHLKPLLLLFISSIAISVYVNFDVTMLGWIKGDYAVGLYAVAVKIYTIIKTMAAAIYSVAVPRLAAYLGENRDGEYKKLYTDLWSWISLLLIPSGIGLISISQEVMVVMGGIQYAVATPTLQILSVSLVFAVWGGLITAVHNIIVGKERDNLIATVFAALINCGLNFIFIPLFNQNGAAFTTVLSELFVCGFCFMRIEDKKRYLDLSKLKRTLKDSVLGSAAIFMLAFVIKKWISGLVMRMGFIMVGSVLLYVWILYGLKNPYVSEAISMVKKLTTKKAENQ